MDLERPRCDQCGRPTLLSRGGFPACRTCGGDWNTEVGSPDLTIPEHIINETDLAKFTKLRRLEP